MCIGISENTPTTNGVFKYCRDNLTPECIEVRTGLPDPQDVEVFVQENASDMASTLSTFPQLDCVFIVDIIPSVVKRPVAVLNIENQDDDILSKIHRNTVGTVLNDIIEVILFKVKVENVMANRSHLLNLDIQSSKVTYQAASEALFSMVCSLDKHTKFEQQQF